MNALPQHILDLIAEFNAEHREQMAPVLQDIEDPKCSNCYNWYTGENNNNNANEKIVHYILWKRYVFCSSWCLNDCEEYVRG